MTEYETLMCFFHVNQVHFALFSARPHDSRKDQFWTPITIKQQYNVQFACILMVYSYRNPKLILPAVMRPGRIYRKTQNAK